MKIRCVWEHNHNDSMLYSDNFVGAFTRGETKEAAIQKMPSEIMSYIKWKGEMVSDSFEPVIIQEKESELTVSDADSDVLFEEEKKPLSISEYEELKALALKSARDFQALYDAIPDKNKAVCRSEQLFMVRFPAQHLKCMSIQKMSMIIILVRLALRQTMKGILWNVDSADLLYWKVRQIF